MRRGNHHERNKHNVFDTSVHVRESSSVKEYYKAQIKEFGIPVTLTELYRIGAAKLFADLRQGTVQARKLRQEVMHTQ